MNAEQKQRAEQIVSQWNHTSAGTMAHAWAGRSAVALLQDLIDMPAPSISLPTQEPLSMTEAIDVARLAEKGGA